MRCPLPLSLSLLCFCLEQIRGTEFVVVVFPRCGRPPSLCFCLPTPLILTAAQTSRRRRRQDDSSNFDPQPLSLCWSFVARKSNQSGPTGPFATRGSPVEEVRAGATAATILAEIQQMRSGVIYQLPIARDKEVKAATLASLLVEEEIIRGHDFSAQKFLRTKDDRARPTFLLSHPVFFFSFFNLGSALLSSPENYHIFWR